MFTASIRFTDFSAPVSLDGGGIVFGSSAINPFTHRLLRSLILESERFLAVICLERLADEPQRTEHLCALSDRALIERLRAVRHHLLDWSILSIDKRRTEVRYTTSLLHSAPVYLWSAPEAVEIDWDYFRLLAGREARIDDGAALAYIGGIGPYSARTMVTGLHRSIAGTTLIVDTSGIRSETPALPKPRGPGQLVEGASPEDLLYGTVKTLIGVRPACPARTAVEISGGMDSGLIALAAADVLGPGLFSYGAQFSGAMGDAQRKRRRMLCNRSGYDDLEIPADRFPPFNERSRRRIRHGVWPQDENYPEMFEAVFGVLDSAGIDTLISGFGGDELYAAYVGEEPEVEDPHQRPRHPFLTDKGWQLAREAAGENISGPLQETSWLAAAGRSQRLLRRGIWPIYPYNFPALAAFVSSLPWPLRRDRALLRETLTRRLGNPVFQQDYVKETFLDVAIQGVVKNRGYLRALLEQSPMMRPEYVDIDRVTAALEGDVAALPRNEFGSLFLILSAACFFQDGRVGR